MRRRIYEIIEPGKQSDKLSNAYDFIMMLTIIVSIIPLAFKEETACFRLINTISVFIFKAAGQRHQSVCSLSVYADGHA